MCYDANAIPPVHGQPVTSATGSPLTLTSEDGTSFAAFLARPEQPSGIGVLVLPDNIGLRRFYEQLSLRLAEQGHTALAVDYYTRTAGIDYAGRGEEFSDMANLMSHLKGLTKEGLWGDIGAGVEHLRAISCRSVTALGFCLGGRFAFLTAEPRFGLSCAIGFYGATMPINGAPGPAQLAAELTAPILGLFGGADEGIPPEAVAEFDQALTDAAVEHEIVTYPGAPHGFFDGNEQARHAEACADSWRRVLAFLHRHAT